MNSRSSSPVCTIVAGPNGAGKTTFALKWLPEMLETLNFVNADLIAAGLSPLSPEKEWISASRIFLREINSYIDRREDFVFETTLSGKTYLGLVKRLMALDWVVNLYYLWIPDVNMSINRIAERVKAGGHAITDEAAIRRYPRSLKNLIHHFAPLCSTTICLDNAGSFPEIIFTQSKQGLVIANQDCYNQILSVIDHV